MLVTIFHDRDRSPSASASLGPIVRTEEKVRSFFSSLPKLEERTKCMVHDNQNVLYRIKSKMSLGVECSLNSHNSNRHPNEKDGADFDGSREGKVFFFSYL